MKSSSHVGRLIPLPDPFLGGFRWKWHTGSHSLHRRLLDTKWKRTKCKKSQNIKQASCWFKTIYERHKTVCNENNILPQSTQAPRLLCWQWVWMIKRRLWNESKGRRWTIRKHYSAYALPVRLLAEEAKVKLVQECFSIQPVKESIFMPVKCSPGGQLSAEDDRCWNWLHFVAERQITVDEVFFCVEIRFVSAFWGAGIRLKQISMFFLCA